MDAGFQMALKGVNLPAQLLRYAVLLTTKADSTGKRSVLPFLTRNYCKMLPVVSFGLSFGLLQALHQRGKTGILSFCWKVFPNMDHTLFRPEL